MSLPLLLGNVRANIPDASEERNNGGAHGFSRILFKCFPCVQIVRRVVSSNRFKTTECSHLHTSLSYVHYKLSAEYRMDKKRRLRVQNRSAGCVLTHPDSRKYLSLPLKTRYISSEYFPSV